jgi:hypothetical protein
MVRASRDNESILKSSQSSQRNKESIKIKEAY